MRSPDDSHELHPWRVILGVLQELPSDEVVRIINLAGLPVDWQLTEDQRYSHKTRKRAYMPRIADAFSDLSPEKKLRVSWIVAKEMAEFSDKRYSDLDTGLQAIGWEIKDEQLTVAEEEVRELFFPTGATHDAYVNLREILHGASDSLMIVDPYLDESILEMISGVAETIYSVQFLSSNLKGDFKLEVRKFTDQYSDLSLEVRKTTEFHDRFIIVDESKCYHIGASIKDAGGKAFMISKVEDIENRKSLIEQIEGSWEQATLVDLD